MIDLNIKNNNDKIIAEYSLKQNDRIDNLTLGMIVNNEIEGVIPVRAVQIENDKFFQYDITGMVTMKKYLGEFVKKERILKTFYGIALTIKESMEYMINWTSFSLEKKEIYINEETGKVGLICLPLLSVINDGNTCNFFKNILFSSQFDFEENGDYVGKLITFLNPKTYTLEKFIYELEEMLEIEHKVFETEKEEIEEIEEKEEENEAADDAEKAAEIKTADDAEKAAENEAADDAERAAENEAADDAEKAAENETADEKEIEAVEKATEAAQEKETENEEVVRPFLIRVSNNQRIVIDKDRFVIGKDENKADYCISGSSAISEEHAFIVRNDKEYFLIDNNSKNHTYMNRVLIQSDEEVYIPHGAHLRFADEDFEFKMHE